jgi:hypothetical protein
MTARNRLTIGAPVLLALWFAGEAPASDGPSMSVFITARRGAGRPEVDDATKNALRKNRDDAAKARQALEKQIKAQFGKKREQWPPAKDEALYKLEQAAAMANADFEYRKIDPKEISDAVEDLRRAAQGKGVQAGKKDRITIATSAAAADLVLEVAGRRAKKQFGAVVPSDCWVLFSIGSGGKVDAARFRKVPPTYRPKKFMMTAWKIASPSPEKPVFTFEAWNGGGTPVGCHGAAANSAAGLIDKFIEDNHATLKAK